MPAPGEIAPDFELPNQDGKMVRLSDYRGKKVILFAYPKAGMPGCTKQACGLRDSFPRIHAANAVVLGISPDKPAALKKWKDKENLPYDLLSDPDHRVLEAWGAWGDRAMYGRLFRGVIRSHWVIGEDGILLDEQIKISPDKSVQKAVQSVASP